MSSLFRCVTRQNIFQKNMLRCFQCANFFGIIFNARKTKAAEPLGVFSTWTFVPQVVVPLETGERTFKWACAYYMRATDCPLAKVFPRLFRSKS